MLKPPSKRDPEYRYLLIPSALLIVIGLSTYFYSRKEPIESGPAGAVPLDVSDPATLEQNGQPLTNNGSVSGTQSFQNTQPVNQSPQSSNLQGSPSTQEAAPANNIPNDWLE